MTTLKDLPKESIKFIQMKYMYHFALKEDENMQWLSW